MSEDTLEIEIADEIKHLSSDEIEELYKKYLDGEKNSVLVSDYKININPNKLIKILPPRILDDALCPYCDIPMYTKRRSKSASSWDILPIECHDCNHKIFPEKLGYRSQQCGCEECVIVRRQQKLEAEKEKRETIRELYDIDDREPIDYSELTFFNKLVLLTLFRMQTDEDFEYILSLDDPSRTESLSPTEEMDIECLKELFSCSVVIIDPESRVEAFVEDEEFKSFYITRTRWIPNITFDGIERANLSKVYKEIYQEIKSGIQSQWEKEIFKTLFRIAREEVLQYVHVRADELNVNFSAENKTREVVNQLLQQFSVSEIYYFVKKSVENAHIYYSKGYANNKKHAANTIPNKILSLGERAIDEGWNTYKYSRDSRAPRSYISQVFYDFFLQDEDAGFHKAPGKHWEQELHPRHFCESEASNESELSCTQCKSQNVAVQMANGGLELTCQYCGSIEQFTPSK
ncbi:hypothetical protein [uncultured Shewanella sp.]|uniref:hypothetical protein n=1 Tax=uncultured Shewanella sp. TaxID=173975 RepID=UPI002628CD74|nr:hypothetical protein [uncultured Shewanella sp.]